MENKNIIFEGVTFYPAAFEKTEKEFIKHEKHTGLDEKQLKEVYALATSKKEITDGAEFDTNKLQLSSGIQTEDREDSDDRSSDTK